MYNRILKRVELYMSPGGMKETEANKLVEFLSAEGLEIAVIKEANADIAEWKAGMLFLTDDVEFAEALAVKGYPVIGYLTERNRQASFSKVRYLTAEPEGLCGEYPERVYRRYMGLPWQILCTERCILRETTEADVDAFYALYADAAITRYMEPLLADREEELRYTAAYRKNVYEFYDFGVWTVVEKGRGEIIGRAGLTIREGYEEPELGFMIGVPWQRQGIAKEICHAILQYAVEELGFYRIQALTEPGNTASLALLEDLGFCFEDKCIEKNTKYLRYIKILDIAQVKH